jgi:hypothetical protein
MPSFSPLARRSGMQRHTLMNTRTKLATDDLVTMEGVPVLVSVLTK